MAVLSDRQSCPRELHGSRSLWAWDGPAVMGTMDCPGQGPRLGLWETISAWHMLPPCWVVPGTVVRIHMVPYSLKGPLSCMAPGRHSTTSWIFFMVHKICCLLCELSVWQLRRSRQVCRERKVLQDGYSLLLQFWVLTSFSPLPSH